MYGIGQKYEPKARAVTEFYRDPVCGMTVDPAADKPRMVHRGVELRFCCNGCKTKFEANPADYAAAEDPVCGMSVQRANARHFAKHSGAKHYFCSARCLERFEATPEAFAAEAPPPPPAPPGTTYICPMCPEVESAVPADCPICGMALEPATPSLDDGPNPELIDFTRRLWVSALCAIPVVILAMGPMVGLPIRTWLGENLSNWLELAFAAPAVLWAARPIFTRGWASLLNRHANMWTLLMMGIGAAALFSTLATLAPGLFPPAFRRPDGSAPVYFEAATVIIALVFLGQVLELRARARTGDAIRALLDLSPKFARRIDADGRESDIPLDQLRAGDILRIRPGEAAPVDGVIVEGASAFDESLLTGEAAPVAKTVGDAVIGGAINGVGAVVMRAERVGTETTLSRIVALVAQAQRSRAPIQSLADKAAAWFTPLVVGAALLAFTLWAAFGPSPSLGYGLTAAVSVLIIACPCALGLATPMSVMVAAGRGARAGVLMRDAESLERLSKVNVLVIDKTGTITEGKPRITEVYTVEGVDEDALLALAAGIEAHSEHPLAAAVLRAAEARGLAATDVSDFQAVPGRGGIGRAMGGEVAIGDAAFMRELGLDPDESAAEILRKEGKTAIFIAAHGALAGMLAAADPIKAGAVEALSALRASGLRIIMATGDAETTARAVARRVGVDEFRAGQSPADKAALVRSLQAQGGVVAMAGDGINDAPALAQADVGIAMGGGADVAIESAGVTLMQGELSGVLRARRLSTATMDNIRQNLGFAFGYNLIGVPVAAGALYPLFGLLLSPMIAAAAMSLSSASVIFNALRLSRVRL